MELLAELRRLHAVRASERQTGCRTCGWAIELRRGPGRPRVRCSACAFEELYRRIVRESGSCRRCGSSYHSVRHNQRFCCKQCKDASREYASRARKFTARVCAGCGVRLTGRARKYCTPLCGRRLRRHALRQRRQSDPVPACHNGNLILILRLATGEARGLLDVSGLSLAESRLDLSVSLCSG